MTQMKPRIPALAGLVLVLAACQGQPSATPGDSGAATASPVTTAGATATSVTTFEPPDLEGLIVFTRAGGEYGDETVFVANADGTDERQVAPQTCCPRIAPDGSRILMAASAPGDAGVTVAITDLDGANRTVVPLPGDGLNLGPGAWSPDGTQILFEGWDDADPSRDGLYLGNPDGTGLVRVTDASGLHDLTGDFAPDGSQAVFLRHDPSGPNPGTLFVTPISGGELVQLTPDDFDVQCCFNYRWSPDGNTILFADTAGSLWTVAPDGSSLTELYSDPQGRYAITPAWSPDGTQIMFALDPSADPFAHPANGLYVMEADGSNVRPVLLTDDFKRQPEWIATPVTTE